MFVAKLNFKGQGNYCTKKTDIRKQAISEVMQWQNFKSQCLSFFQTNRKVFFAIAKQLFLFRFSFCPVRILLTDFMGT